ncbi:Autotransporter-associated beta strand repeat protein [Aeoliella mucimassa]|uniref:Autotransporter-associated beta strand repeat protein n=2 Tax=Aeoliella mucimassa TaxID=2527972 RepID=A0A518AWM4_9BACT|nr:Autotransporter-associated beta strand repeat protein [Aeoliella mucimassa]
MLGVGGSVHALSFGTFGSWDSDTRRNAANNSMQAVVDRFNVYGDFNWGSDGYVDLYYNSGVPTAQAGYYGAIEYGGTWPNERVTQHELNHWLGSGTDGNWYNLFSNNVWTGTKVNALMAQFDGQGTAFRQSGVHFYPYGLNYDSEVTDDSIYMRNVALMYAMRQDMGNGNPNDPWSATSATLTGSDAVGTSAFNWFGGGYSGSYAGWSDRYFAHAGADYSTGAYDIRTPRGAPSWEFAGDSLTINTGGRLLYNSSGTSGIVTIDQLVLDGGTLRHDQTRADLFQLAGHLTLAQTSTIEAAQGDMLIHSQIGGTSGFRKTGSFALTLKSSANNYTGTTIVAAGTIIVDGATGYGLTTVNRGATLAGSGIVRGDLTAVSDSTLRVGGSGLVERYASGQQLVDDFTAYATGQLGSSPNSTGDVWSGVFDGTSYATIVDNSGNQALRVEGVNSGGDSWRGAVTELNTDYTRDFSLADGETGTYFFRVRRNESGDIDTIFGLTDLTVSTDSGPGGDIDSPWNEYAVLLSMVGNQSSSTLRAYSNGQGDVGLTTTTDSEWVNVWLEVDNDRKLYRVATSTGDEDGTYRGGTYQFGRRTAGTVGDQSLVTFGIYERLGVGVELDDLFFAEGTNLSNPLNSSSVLSGEILTIEGDLNLTAGALLELDLGNGANDSLVVSGNAVLDGYLNLVLDANYTPTLNETFTLLTASDITNHLTLSGAVADMFTLSQSTATELILTAVSGMTGDFNNDGLVNLADYTVWRDHLGSAAATLLNDESGEPIGMAQYEVWKASFATAGGGPRIDAVQGVPEPTSVMLLGLGVLLGFGCRKPQS